jgi:hypothetical protein
MKARDGFTLVELLAAVGITVCLGGLLVPAIEGVKDAADRTACAANLCRLLDALRLYAHTHDGYLPDIGAASARSGPVPCDGRHVRSRADAPGTCAWPDVRAVGNQANLWLLVREGYAEPAVFVCPATPDRPSRNRPRRPRIMSFLEMEPDTGAVTDAEQRFLDEIGGGRCSYSYQNQLAHPGTTADVAPAANATTHLTGHPADLAVLADRNPYTRPGLVRQTVVSPFADPAANSLNHAGTGQNVAYLSGAVEWHETPCCGAARGDGTRDNIYWPDDGWPDDPLAVPGHERDSHLVP